MFREIISFLNTPIFASAPAEVEDAEFEFELLEEAPPTRPAQSPLAPVVIEILDELDEEDKAMEEPAPVGSSIAGATFQKLKTAQEEALIKKADLLEQQLFQERTRELLKEMGGAGLLPAQLQALEAEVKTEQEQIDSLLEQLGF